MLPSMNGLHCQDLLVGIANHEHMSLAMALTLPTICCFCWLGLLQVPNHVFEMLNHFAFNQ